MRCLTVTTQVKSIYQQPIAFSNLISTYRIPLTVLLVASVCPWGYCLVIVKLEIEGRLNVRAAPFESIWPVGFFQSASQIRYHRKEIGTMS